MTRARNVFTWVVLVGAIGIAALILLPSILGFDRYVINGSSMEPTIPKGSVVYSTPEPTEALAVGDIITYQPPASSGVDELVTHRIIEKNERTGVNGKVEAVFRTKGDNNASADPWTFTLDDGDGALEKAHIPYLGWIYLALGVPWVRILLITVPALLILVFTAISLWREAGREVEEAQRKLDAQAAGVNPPGTA